MEILRKVFRDTWKLKLIFRDTQMEILRVFKDTQMEILRKVFRDTQTVILFSEILKCKFYVKLRQQHNYHNPWLD